MNERIKQLAELARKKPMGDSWCYTNPQEFEQKFAELIVRECIQICMQGKQTQTTSDGVATLIKLHFNVQE